MLSIFICEDDAPFLAYVKKEVEKYTFDEDLAMEIVCAVTTPGSIINHLQNNPPVAGLYFLDLDLKCDINGINLAETIRKHDPRGFIVFITSDVESHKLVFKHKVEALDYIEKSSEDLQARIHECMKNAVEKFKAKATPLQDNLLIELAEDAKGLKGYNNLGKDYLVSVDKSKIICFMTEPQVKHAVILYTSDGDRMVFNGSLKRIEAELDDKRFYRCQKNLIVNIEKIVAVNPVTNELQLADGVTVDVPYRQIKKLVERVGMDKIRITS